MVGLYIVLRSLARGARGFAKDPKSRGVLTLAAGLVMGGALFYRRVEDLSWVDSFYLTIITLTTVGYGDISPQTTGGKVFTMAYLLIGIGVLLAVITEITRHLIESNEARQEERSNK